MMEGGIKVKTTGQQRGRCSLTMVFLNGGGRRFLTRLLSSFGDWGSSGGGLRGGHLDLDSDDEDDDGDVATLLQWFSEWSPRPPGRTPPRSPPPTPLWPQACKPAPEPSCSLDAAPSVMSKITS